MSRRDSAAQERIVRRPFPAAPLAGIAAAASTAATGVAATRRRGVATARRGRTRCLVAGVPAAAGAAAAADVGCLVFA